MSVAAARTLDDTCRTALREGSFAAGLSVAVTDRENVISSGVFGYADETAELPVTGDTR